MNVYDSRTCEKHTTLQVSELTILVLCLRFGVPLVYLVILYVTLCQMFSENLK